jgi:hypothetical protein
MAKIDIANAIVEEFPEKALVAEEIKDKYTEEELKKLQSDLREGAETKDEPEQGTPASQYETNEKTVKYRLKDPKTQYGEGSFSLAGEQEKELPDNPSPELLARIRSGFLVEVE